ncbi:hypothetical protein [Paenibacillus sp. J2TS4]|uniref:hypothetical protein n=1 Tax=Paenibacillus sp. J2TS4 TaxID=2807194 RepID=UPI001AFCE1E3|nr:hypothetical protein [Paenibacillus sp. J2TS4]GIP32658.1 hypothetical protein J2TS4_18680 [Paenibacillus sp. J2TS4]
MKLKGFYRLLNYEFSLMLRAVLLLSLGAILSPLMFLNVAMKDYTMYSVHERFEDLYVSSGCVIVFLIYFASLCAFFVKTFYAGYWGSKSIYTFLTLPVKREVVYFSKLSAFAIGVMVLLAAQLISVWLGYEMVAAKVGEWEGGKFVMANGLFLAFIRSAFLRMVLPLNINGFLSSVSILLTMITGFYYGVLCERSKRYWGFIFIVAAVVLLINVISYRMTPPAYYVVYKNLYLTSGMLFLLSGFFMWHSIRLIKRGAIA